MSETIKTDELAGVLTGDQMISGLVEASRRLRAQREQGQEPNYNHLTIPAVDGSDVGVRGVRFEETPTSDGESEI
jgi:hypothetical protein